MAMLTLSTGETVKNEPLRQKALSQGHECLFCGYASDHNQLFVKDGDTSNIHDNNIAVADSVCLAWQQLNTLTFDSATLAYLPGLAAQDINHLQRTLLAAMDDAQYRDTAISLLNWLSSHQRCVEEAWGTAHPQAFAQVLRQLPSTFKNKVHVWQGIAVIVHPKRIANPLKNNLLETTTRWWSALYQDYKAR